MMSKVVSRLPTQPENRSWPFHRGRQPRRSRRPPFCGHARTTSTPLLAKDSLTPPRDAPNPAQPRGVGVAQDLISLHVALRAIAAAGLPPTTHLQCGSRSRIAAFIHSTLIDQACSALRTNKNHEVMDPAQLVVEIRTEVADDMVGDRDGEAEHARRWALAVAITTPLDMAPQELQALYRDVRSLRGAKLARFIKKLFPTAHRMMATFAPLSDTH